MTTATQTACQRAAAMYRTHHSERNALDMARAFKEAVAESESQQALSRQIRIPVGTIHAYISLLNLPEGLQRAIARGQIGFKCAKAFADLHVADEKLLELAQPFLDRTLSSVYVEQYVKLAKQHPQATVKELIDRIKHPEAYMEHARNGHSAPRRQPAPVKEYLEPPAVTLDDVTALYADLLAIAGRVEDLPRKNIPEYMRLKICNALKILDARLHNTMGAMK